MYLIVDSIFVEPLVMARFSKWHKFGVDVVMETKTQLNNTDKLLKAILSDDIRKFREKKQRIAAISKAS